RGECQREADRQGRDQKERTQAEDHGAQGWGGTSHVRQGAPLSSGRLGPLGDRVGPLGRSLESRARRPEDGLVVQAGGETPPEGDLLTETVVDVGLEYEALGAVPELVGAAALGGYLQGENGPFDDLLVRLESEADGIRVEVQLGGHSLAVDDGIAAILRRQQHSPALAQSLP